MLKKTTAIILFLFLFYSIAESQKGNKVWIKTYDEPFFMHGTLYTVSDSTISILTLPKLYGDYYIKKQETVDLSISNIKTISLRSKKSIYNGMIIGTIVGFTAGTIIASSKPNPEFSSPTHATFMYRFLYDDTVMYGGAVGGLVGCIAGGLLGSIKIKIPINGNKENYYKNYKKIKNRALK